MDIWNELIDAWKLCELKRLPDDYILWGKSIRWWARLGIGVQFTGVITLIVEIIGPERIRSLGARLENKRKRNNSFSRMKWIINWPKRLYDIAKGASKGTLKEKANSIIDSFTLRIYSSLIALMLMIAAIPDPTDLIIYPVLIIIFVITVISLILSVLLAGYAVSFDIIILRPVAWILEHKHLSKFLKILSLLAVLFGIHFGLLAA